MKIVTASPSIIVVTADIPNTLVVDAKVEQFVFNAPVPNFITDALDGPNRSYTAQESYWVWGDGEWILWGDVQEILL